MASFKHKIRILDNVKPSEDIRFANYGDHTVIYPAMGHMTVEEVTDTVSQVAAANKGKMYSLDNLPIPWLRALAVAQANGYIQDEEYFSDRPVNCNEFKLTPTCHGLFKTFTGKKHKDLIEWAKKQKWR